MMMPTSKKVRPDGNKVGRPSKYTPEMVKEIVGHIENGATFRDACNLSDISEATFNQWRNDFPEFSEAVNKAKAGFKQYHVQNIKKASEKTWTASAWMLERRYKDEYSQKIDVNKQIVNVQLNLEAGSADALIDYIDTTKVDQSQVEVSKAVLEGGESSEG